ncbi:MAG: methyltransferase domain-containing protein [Thermomicrobiales bacterium]|nr:methyltransferase domain-containing protein [Thermomicrobiales bacterium]
MDGPELDPVELAANLRDIRRVNRWLGGTAIVLRLLPELLTGLPLGRPVRVLDLATGSADIPLAVAAWAERRGIPIEIVASDYSDDILTIAHEQLAGTRGIALAKHDARQVTLPDGSADIVLCSLSLHHFDPGDAVRVLREMQRLANHGFIVNDLRRSRMGYIAAWVAGRLTTRNRLTRNDAPLSVRRAYTPAELRELLRQAGVANATVTTHAWFRMAAVAITRRDGDG